MKDITKFEKTISYTLTGLYDAQSASLNCVPWRHHHSVFAQGSLRAKLRLDRFNRGLRLLEAYGYMSSSPSIVGSMNKTRWRTFRFTPKGEALQDYICLKRCLGAVEDNTEAKFDDETNRKSRIPVRSTLMRKRRRVKRR